MGGGGRGWEGGRGWGTVMINWLESCSKWCRKNCIGEGCASASREADPDPVSFPSPHAAPPNRRVRNSHLHILHALGRQKLLLQTNLLSAITSLPTRRTHYTHGRTPPTQTAHAFGGVRFGLSGGGHCPSACEQTKCKTQAEGGNVHGLLVFICCGTGASSILEILHLRLAKMQEW